MYRIVMCIVMCLCVSSLSCHNAILAKIDFYDCQERVKRKTLSNSFPSLVRAMATSSQEWNMVDNSQSSTLQSMSTVSSNDMQTEADITKQQAHTDSEPPSRMSGASSPVTTDSEWVVHVPDEIERLNKKAKKSRRCRRETSDLNSMDISSDIAALRTSLESMNLAVKVVGQRRKAESSTSSTSSGALCPMMEDDDDPNKPVTLQIEEDHVWMTNPNCPQLKLHSKYAPMLRRLTRLEATSLTMPFITNATTTSDLSLIHI